MTHQQPLFHQNSTWLHYVGRYYNTTDAFVQEAEKQGITRRIPAQVGRGMRFGDRLVFLRWAGPGKVWAFAEGVIRGVTLENGLAKQVGEKLAESGRAVFIEGGHTVARACGSYFVAGTWQVNAEMDEIIALAVRLAARQEKNSPFVMINLSLTKTYNAPVYLSPAPGFTPGFIRSDDTSFVYEAPAEHPTITAIIDYHKRGERRAAMPFSLPMSTGRTSSNARHWQCVSDPTKEPELAWPGDFYGGRFRFKDLQASQENHTWPDGITFRNVQTGERLAYLRGELVTL